MKSNEITDYIKRLENLNKELKYLPQDIAVLAVNAFDKNFTTQSFFGKKWKPSKYVENENAKRKKSRSLLQNKGMGGGLRGSITYTVSGNAIIFSSNKPYAAIHNKGGTIKHPGGTAYFYDKKQNKSIWVSNRKASGKNYKRTKPHDIKIEQRQFIGSHIKLTKQIEKHVEAMIKQHGFDV